MEPSFTLHINWPKEAIKDDAAMPMEITMTNTSHEGIPLGGAIGPPMPFRFLGSCTIDIRNQDGRQLQERPAIRRYLGWVESGARIVLDPGEQLHVEALLNELFDLSKPGRYTVQVLRKDYLTKTVVKSNMVTVSVGEPERPAKGAKAAFSVALSAPYNVIKTGYQTPIQITWENISNYDITLAVWQGDFGDAGVDGEFALGMEIRDSQGHLAPLTKSGQTFESGDDLPRGKFKFVVVRPGESYEETRRAGDLYDLRKPGDYTVEVSQRDPVSRLLVKSNPLRLRVATLDASAHLAPQPSFLIGIRLFSETADTAFQSERKKIYSAVTNLADHPIRFDNTNNSNELEVYDSHGNIAPMTASYGPHHGKLGRGPSEPSGGISVLPRETQTITRYYLDEFYNLSQPGEYIVQLESYDPESKSIVKSNRVNVTVPERQTR